MTREERTELIEHLQYSRSIGADYLITDKDVDEIIKALEQEPCDDAISRQAVFEIQAKYAEHMGATKYWQMRDDIRALPPVRPQEQTGHWIDDTKYGGTECSKCGKWYPHATIAKSEIKFCSECGAKMVEPKEKSDKV